MNRQQQELLRRALEPFGATFEITTGRNCHEKVIIRRGGEFRFVFKSSTASCPRAFLNFLGDAKRAAKGIGNG